MDVPSSPPDLAGAAAAKSRRRQGQGSTPCFSPCDVYAWACSPHKQRDLEGKSGAAAAGVAWSQGRASGQLWEERSSSPTARGCVWLAGTGEGAFPLLGDWGNHGGQLHSAEQGQCCWHILNRHWRHTCARAASRCPERWRDLTSKGSQPLHHSRMFPDRHNESLWVHFLRVPQAD